MNKIITSILVLLFAVGLYGCSEEQEEITPSGKSIKVGFIGPMSGADKVLGEDSLRGVQTALHMKPYLNNGDSVELLIEDDKNIPQLTVKAFVKLVEKDKVAAVIVASSSASGLSINALADQYQIPVVILLASHPDISKNTKFVVQVCFDNNFQANVAALFVRDELFLERVAVLKNPDSYHSSSLADEFTRRFRNTEGQVIEVIELSSKIIDYGEILSRLREEDVQLLYLPMAVGNVVAISKELSKIKWKPRVMGGDGLLARAFAESPKDVRLLEGFYAIDLYSNTMEKTPSGIAAAKVFRSLFKKRRKSTFPAIGFEGMGVLMNAMDRCYKSSDKHCLNRKLHNTVDFEGLMGNITILANGKASRPLVVNRIRRGQLESVVKVY